MNKTATCACAQVSIALEGAPKLHGICHCTNCKRRTGSAFGFSSYFLCSSVTRLGGETHSYAFHNAEQNHDQVRHFCPRCGTTLYWYRSDAPDLIGVAAGCFAEAALAEPRFSAAHTQKENWLEIPQSWKRLPG
jgi:hypothetical protein